MHIDNLPGCCTSAVLFSFGEHGEPSEVSVARIHELCTVKQREGKRCVLATSIDKANVRMLRLAGFKEISSYPGIQGRVRIMKKDLEIIPEVQIRARVGQLGSDLVL